MAASRKGKRQSPPPRSAPPRQRHPRPPDRQTIASALQDSEARYRALVELCPDPIVVHSHETIVYVNPAAIQLLGAHDETELLGTSIWDVLHPDTHALARQRLQQIRTEGRAAAVIDVQLMRRDGQRLDVEVAGAAITYAGQPAIQSVLRDVTERRRAAQALQASEEQYRNLFENANDAIATFSVEGIITSMNRGAERLLGWRREELVGQHYRAVAPPASVAVADERTRRFLVGEAMESIFEIELLHKEGTRIPVEARTRPMKEREGQVIGFQGIFRDLRERQRMEGARRESEAKYQTIFNVSPDFMYLTDLEGRVLDANAAVVARAGLSLDQVRQRHFLEFFAGEDRDALRQAYAELIRTRQATLGLEVQAKNARGEVFDYEVNATPLVEGEAVTGVLSLARDITERKRAERELQAARHLRERIADTIPEILYLYDLQARMLVYINRQLFAVLGYPLDEWQTKGAAALRKFFHPEDLVRLREREARVASLADGEVVETEVRVKHANGEWRSLLVRDTVFLRTPEGAPAQILGVVQDITERRRLEQLFKERALEKEDMPARLRDFRHTLRLSQTEFGKTFGGYSQSQISAYESGEVDISLGLILAIRAQGYPVEAVLGTGKSTVLDDTITYLPAFHPAKVLACDLIVGALQLLGQDRQAVEALLQGLGLPSKDYSEETQKLLAQLVARTKSPE